MMMLVQRRKSRLLLRILGKDLGSSSCWMCADRCFALRLITFDNIYVQALQWEILQKAISLKVFMFLRKLLVDGDLDVTRIVAAVYHAVVVALTDAKRCVYVCSRDYQKKH